VNCELASAAELLFRLTQITPVFLEAETDWKEAPTVTSAFGPGSFMTPKLPGIFALLTRIRPHRNRPDNATDACRQQPFPLTTALWEPNSSSE
jgi:hypothetical protein